MKTRQQIKDTVALEHGHATWLDMLKDNSTNYAGLNYMIDKAMRLYAEESLEKACQNVGLLETTAYSNSKEIVCVNHRSIIYSMPDIVKTIRVDQGTILIIKEQLK